MPTRQRTGFKILRYCLQNFSHFHHTTRAKFTTGHFTLIRANHLHAIGFQYRQITLGGWVIPHTDIHGRCNHHMSISGQ